MLLGCWAAGRGLHDGGLLCAAWNGWAERLTHPCWMGRRSARGEGINGAIPRFPATNSPGSRDKRGRKCPASYHITKPTPSLTHTLYQAMRYFENLTNQLSKLTIPLFTTQHTNLGSRGSSQEIRSRGYPRGSQPRGGEEVKWAGVIEYISRV